MAVAFVTDTDVVPATAGSFVANITVSGTNPVLGLSVAFSTSTQTLDSVTSDVDGALTRVGSTVSGINSANVGMFVKAAPTAGAHVLTATFSGSTAYNANAWVYSGADQTTPIPAADVVTDTTVATTNTLTPTNLTANDGSVGVACNTSGNDVSSVTPNQRYVENSTAANIGAGDATGTTGVTFNFTAAGGSGRAMMAARIAAAGGAPPVAEFGGPSSPLFRVRLRQY